MVIQNDWIIAYSCQVSAHTSVTCPHWADIMSSNTVATCGPIKTNCYIMYYAKLCFCVCVRLLKIVIIKCAQHVLNTYTTECFIKGVKSWNYLQSLYSIKSPIFKPFCDNMKCETHDTKKIIKNVFLPHYTSNISLKLSGTR